MFPSSPAEDGGVDNVSRPLIALLVGTVALFALYFVALRGNTTQGTSKQSLKGFQSDISAAHQAVATANHAAAAAGGNLAQPSNASTSAGGAQAAATRSSATTASSGSKTDASKAQAAHAANSAKASSAAVAATGAAATQHRLNVVAGALTQHKVLALLFYNPAASDDRAVKQELATVPTHHNRVVKLAVPIGELSRYQVVDTQVPVNQTPTLVLIDRSRQAMTIVGYTSAFEISQRVDDALAVP